MLELKTVILECKDIKRLVSFYSNFLEWNIVFEEEGFVRIQSPVTGVGIAFQYDEDYIPPVWPSQVGQQQMMAHIDFGVATKSELEEMVQKALNLGATIADCQYGDGAWLTMLDPAGHPFCIVIWE